jgi:hypothetical protein
MAFADFDLRRAVEKFHLEEDREADLFPGVAPLELTGFLRVWLDEFAPVALGVNSDQARSAFIITPLLAEAKRRAGRESNVLPGVRLDVNPMQGLDGACDFILTRSAEYYYLHRPVGIVVAARRDDLITGLGPCVAAMATVRLFNEKDKTPVPALYGCVTGGTNWRFLKLAGARLSIDRRDYYLSDAGRLVQIFVNILGGSGSPDHASR